MLVKSVNLLPDQNERGRSDTKVYRTIVTIDGTHGDLNPGLTAVVEIDVGKEIASGTRVVSGLLTIEATRVGRDATYGRIITAVERAA